MIRSVPPIIFVLLLVLLSAQAAANTSTASTQAKASVRVNLEQIMLPADEPMGILGTSYLIEIQPNLYFGPAAYSSITGQRGGFYTAGGELAWQRHLMPHFILISGAYVGGGGGSPTMVGGGLMIRPHADLLWDFGTYSAGISISSVRFPNGIIASNQAGISANFDTEILCTDFVHRGQLGNWRSRDGVGFDRASMVLGTYYPSKRATDLGGNPLQQSIGHVGARMEQFVTPRAFWGLEAAGAYSGGVPGYAEFLGTLGVETPVWSDLISVGSRVALGTGGGGYVVDVGGGLLFKAGLYATAHLNKDAHASLEGGLAAAPTGNFRASYSLVSLHWDLDHPHHATGESHIVGNEWLGGTQHYILAARKDGSQQDMDLITLKMNRYVSESLYLTGQAHSAYAGGAGGYSVGLVGMGYRTAEGPWHAGAELLAGAGAGGWVNSSGGAVAQSMIYLSREIAPALTARLGLGKIKSMQGQLNSPIVDLGLSYAFGSNRRD